MSTKLSLETTKDLRAAVETARLEKGMSLRGVAAAADVAHGSYWVWLRSKTADVTLSKALAYSKAVGIKLNIGE